MLETGEVEPRVAAWLRLREPLERQLAPLGYAVLERLALRLGERVVDIGCGIGRTPEMIAEAVGPNGCVTAIDVLPDAVAVLRKEGSGQENRLFVVGDAESFAFQPNSFDVAFSRFGTMFFINSTAAFVNIRCSLRAGGRIGFVCWRGLDDNELDAFPLSAVIDCVPHELISGAATAQHLAFANRGLLTSILLRAGYTKIDVLALDLSVTCGGLEETVAVCSSFGSLGKILRDYPTLAIRAIAALRTALEARPGADDPRLRAAVWVVTATVPG